MSYQVVLKRAAEKDLEAIRGSLFSRIKHKLLSLEQDPRPFGVQKLHDQDAYRIRVSDYRILYLIDDAAKRVDVLSVAHRREAYR